MHYFYHVALKCTCVHSMWHLMSNLTTCNKLSYYNKKKRQYVDCRNFLAVDHSEVNKQHSI